MKKKQPFSGPLSKEQEFLIALIHVHPGKTVSELQKLSKMHGTEIWLHLEPLFDVHVKRRREPDIRTAAILKDPVKYAAARLRGSDLTSTAWRFYP